MYSVRSNTSYGHTSRFGGYFYGCHGRFITLESILPPQHRFFASELLCSLEGSARESLQLSKPLYDSLTNSTWAPATLLYVAHDRLSMMRTNGYTATVLWLFLPLLVIVTTEVVRSK